MTQIKHLLKTFTQNGSLFTHEDKDERYELKHTHCSTFIEKRQLLVKGELMNPKPKERNAMIVLFDPETGEFKGKIFYFCVCLLTQRPWVDNKSRTCPLCVPLRAQGRDLLVCLGGWWEPGHLSAERLWPK